MKSMAVLSTTLAFLLLGLGAAAEQPEVPSLVGEWEGIWGGDMSHSMKITVADQKEGKITGTVTFREGTASLPVQGTIQVSGGKITLVVYVTHFEFAVQQDKLDGYGYGPRHRGPAVLTRRSPAAGVTSDPQRWVGEWVGEWSGGSLQYFRDQLYLTIKKVVGDHVEGTIYTRGPEHPRNNRDIDFVGTLVGDTLTLRGWPQSAFRIEKDGKTMTGTWRGMFPVSASLTKKK